MPRCRRLPTRDTFGGGCGMSYELRVNGRTVGFFQDSERALEGVRLVIARDADVEPEVLDTRTGRAFEPAASIRWRYELASKMGY